MENDELFLKMSCIYTFYYTTIAFLLRTAKWRCNILLTDDSNQKKDEKI